MLPRISMRLLTTVILEIKVKKKNSEDTWIFFWVGFFLWVLHNSNNQTKSCKRMPWIIVNLYPFTFNLSPTTFFSPVVWTQATFISTMTLWLMSCPQTFSSCFTTLPTANWSTTNYSLSDGFRFVRAFTSWCELHVIHCMMSETAG